MDASYYRSRQPSLPALRIGVLLDSPMLPGWTAEVLDHIARSDFAAIELLVLNGRIRKDPSEALRTRSPISLAMDALRDATLRRSFLYRMYQWWDLCNVDPATDPLATVDCSQRLADVESMYVEPITLDCVDRFPEDAIERIRDKKLDVLLRFGFNTPRGAIVSAARCGMWSYYHGDNDHYRGGPCYFWEIVERSPVSAAVLQILSEEGDTDKVLYKGLFATQEGFSQACNRVQPYWGASTFMIHKLHELHSHGWERVESCAMEGAPYQGRRGVYETPSNAQMLGWLAPLLTGKALRRLIRRPTIRHWRLVVRVGAPPIADCTSPPVMNGFAWIDSPRGHFFADPFIVAVDGRHWVFFEDCDYATELGKISCAEVRDGGLGEPMTVLEQPYHLSYPCVFRDHGVLYMIPESEAAGTVQLYRCTRFPDLWLFEQDLLKERAVDTTIWIENGTYWFFVTYREPRGGSSQLWLYSAPSLRGAWTPHPANPISTDVRYARCGGAIFRYEGRLFRPSQDGSGEYGRNLILNEIIALDHEQYREEPRVIVTPNWMKNLAGTHSYGMAGGVEVIDAKARLPATQVL